MIFKLCRCLIILTCATLLASSAFASWTPIGPDGGDARSLALDPHNPDRIFLGTSSGELYLSVDNGKHWAFFVRLGGDDSVFDHILIAPNDSNVMYVSSWNLQEQHASGDIFRTTDGGKNWQTLEGMHGKSIRAIAMAASDSRILVAGAIDGVFRSRDAGDHWERISPEGHADIKNIESIAIDPRNPDVIYAGTWHLPWKTDDGGASWHNIKNGVIDDSDVFSIIVDRTNPAVVFASACSGIYKSETAGMLFHKIQGIPFSARRTRVLVQDPVHPTTVYGGTTEGLWRSVDAGKTWASVTPANVIVNDILIDPRNPSRVLLATDRRGILASDDGTKSFADSNPGFSHRTVTALLADRQAPGSIFAGVVNDKEFGGVFRSIDSGASWVQSSRGLDGRDVFVLRQSPAGFILAGTDRGVMVWSPPQGAWQTATRVLTEGAPKPARTLKSRTGHKVVKLQPAITYVVSSMDARVNDLDVSGEIWWAASTVGLYQSLNQGVDWHKSLTAPSGGLVAVHAAGKLLLIAGWDGLHLSEDAGITWKSLVLPGVASVHDLAVTPNLNLWVASREGLYRSTDLGANWERVTRGLPTRDVTSVLFDAASGRLLVTGAGTNLLWESPDQGETWQRGGDTGWHLLHTVVMGNRVIAATTFNGLVAEPAVAAGTESPVASSVEASSSH